MGREYGHLPAAAAYPDGVPIDATPKTVPPAPAALDPPMVPFALAGIVIWALAGLVLLPFRATLDAHGHGNWLAICLAGFLWGFPGLATMIRHDANRRRRKAAQHAAAQQTAAQPATAPDQATRQLPA
ncbi:MAG: hypothetical protein QOI74_894 [Micromonosporaceae bacterium]|nr:hypothetical protein [Micromonosporaceae bacterium]MDT5038913.1 hypothetical protein [Micromonosporaceae bacterium]